MLKKPFKENTMKSYTVYYLVKEIVSVEVNAENEELAKAKAAKILDVEKRTDGVSCVDGLTEFAGLNINDVWNEINE